MVIIGKIAGGCRALMSVKALRAKAMAVWNEPFYRTFVRWEKQGIFDILWAILLTKLGYPAHQAGLSCSPSATSFKA